MGVWGDPCVVFDADGSLYFGHLSWPNQEPTDWIDRIVVQKSTDGGVTWSDGVGVGHNPPKDQDKEWLAVDLTGSLHHNNLYMAWTEFDKVNSADPNDSTRIVFSRSTDHGITWTAPIRISETGGGCHDGDTTVEGAVPAVGPNGEVYVSWAGHELIYFDKSLDGGVTFGSDVTVTTQPGGWEFDVPGIYRCNGFPVTACDVSNSPYQGHVYVAWSDQRDGLTDTNVYIIKSTDGGATWGPVIQVNDDTSGRHQFFHWLTIDPFTGYIYLVFYDRRTTIGNHTEVYVAQSEDGGATFTNYKISTTSFLPYDHVFFGDYTNIAARNGSVHPIWTRMDNGNLSVWTTQIIVPTGIADGGVPGYGIELSQNYPNPFNPSTTIAFELQHPAYANLSVFDVRGGLVTTLVNGPMTVGSKEMGWDGRDAAGNPVGSGVYFYRLTAGETSLTKKMVLLK
jgi:hypothetical protein